MKAFSELTVLDRRRGTKSHDTRVCAGASVFLSSGAPFMGVRLQGNMIVNVSFWLGVHHLRKNIPIVPSVPSPSVRSLKLGYNDWLGRASWGESGFCCGT